MAQIKRETAIICSISDLNEANYIKTEGWNPSYFETGRGKISRANILGVIVSKEEEGLFLDDGSGKILLRSFEGEIGKNLDVGDLVLVIGRPRIYNEQKYILPEILKKTTTNWASLRKAYLQSKVSEEFLSKKQERVPVPEESKGPNLISKVIEFIRDLDSGDGAEISEVIKRTDSPGSEDIINRLIEEGEVFEIKSGRLKVLE
jgi:hypothetical protein